MNEGITITFLGHSCFRMTYRGFSLVLDPYDASGLPGMRPLSVQADAVLCSHGHYDHAFTQA
ncbi:MAG: Zn-dependent hydrolase, partial [Clostridia bacterium]|nr:Zn-dependent hydrolase [Clostridia bacterium]